ncbi:MAG: PucR family transcriptional regulator [Aeromicrobium sp.]
MPSETQTAPGIPVAAVERVADVARSMRVTLASLSDGMQAEIADSIPELRGDPTMLELLYASIESNVDTLLHFAQGSIALEDIEPPTAAIAYARRLAQRGTSSNALLRAYRLGQRHFVDMALSEMAQTETDGDIAVAAAQLMHELAFAYVDRVAEKVVIEYESERERWLANRNTVRASVLSSLLAGEDIDMATGERALGYRLRQNHLGVVVWDTDREHVATTLQRLESFVAAIAEAVDGAGQPLFIPHDVSLGWAWIPLGWTSGRIDTAAVRAIQAAAGTTMHVALGTPGQAIAGFRRTHAESIRAQTVAKIADARSRQVTNYGETGVSGAALLANDLPAARDLVTSALGDLAADDEPAERLRETLLEFLNNDSSYQTTAERIHAHRNTIRYRVAKALELRGRPLDDDRFDLQLALVACRWLGRAVLEPSPAAARRRS